MGVHLDALINIPSQTFIPKRINRCGNIGSDVKVENRSRVRTKQKNDIFQKKEPV